ncbi:MAG: GNAT family N-acetyltransferase [Oryzihumus sp.]
MSTTGDLLRDIDHYCDAVLRPDAEARPFGPLTLYVADSGGPFHARPAPDGPEVTQGDLETMRRVQRELGVPEAFEWVDQTCPTMATAARASGLVVKTHPLLALTRPAAVRVPDLPAGVRLRVITAADPDLPAVRACVRLAFRWPGTAAGSIGTAERDSALASSTADDLARNARYRERIQLGRTTMVGAFTDEGAVGGGALAPSGEVGEVVGVGVLPALRRRGIAAAITAHLAQEAATLGVRTVFLSAQDAAVARVYARLGFTCVGSTGQAEPPS